MRARKPTTRTHVVVYEDSDDERPVIRADKADLMADLQMIMNSIPTKRTTTVINQECAGEAKTDVDMKDEGS